MRCVFARRVLCWIAVVPAFAISLLAQEAPDTFRWVDFHSPKDQEVITWVTRSLVVQNWTAIREIGVQYDTALVVTTMRPTPQSPADADTFAIWNVSLTNHNIFLLLKGVNLRWLDWMRFADGAPAELAAVYDNCRDCNASTYFTAFHYDVTQHVFAARWMRAGQGVAVWTAGGQPGVDWTQVYAALADPNGSQFIATWNHFDYGKEKLPDEVVYRFDLDPSSRLERTQLLHGKEADSIKLRLCRVQDAPPGLARGQDSPLCQQLVKPYMERKPVTTPPANNRGKSVPPGSRPKQ